MIGPEPDVEFVPAALPVGPLGEQPVGDLAQRAVRPAESGPDPVPRLAEQGAVGVVDPDEFPHGIRHLLEATGLPAY